MGPFPHSAPKAVISAQNPAGTDGFEFRLVAGEGLVLNDGNRDYVFRAVR